MSSKEIAIETGLSYQTVDTYLKKAIAALGVSNRREAARLFQELGLSQKLGSPLPELVPAADVGEPAASARAASWRDLVRPPPLGGKVNRLSWSERTFAALRVTVIGVVTISALALLIAGILRTFR